MQEKRTLGDGMENKFHEVQHNYSIFPVNININNKMKSFIPVEPSSPIYFVPKYTPKTRKLPKYLIKKPKDPKFIPYEPYKAAVEPISICKMREIGPSNMRNFKNDIEIIELVNQMSEMRKLELDRCNFLEEENRDSAEGLMQWRKKKDEYEVDIKNLRESNFHLENQLKFQVQVNSELKTLLVAAVGEDLESRVQHLTEDKLSLARALLNSAHNLTSNQEQTEWLSGQCEVWRSKFLASSVMVEELAKWKSALTEKINDLQEATKTLLEERRKIHRQALKTYHSLKCVTESLSNDGKQPSLQYGNILEVTNINLELSNCIREKLNLVEQDPFVYTIDEQQTLAEKRAYQIIQNPVTITNQQDALCAAVMGAALSLGGSRVNQQHLYVNSCCPHCKGDVQNI